MTVERRTAWSTQLADRDDNILVVSASYDFTGELMDANPDAFNPRVSGTQLWFNEVIETFAEGDLSDRPGPPARLGDYYVQETISGPDPIAADSCVWSHAAVGNIGHALWTGTCPLVPSSGAAADSGASRQPSYSLNYLPGGPLVSATMTAEEHKVARGAWFLPVRDNLPPYGVLDPFYDIDMIAAGLPADYIGTVLIEYEDEYTELVQVDVAGDRQDHGDGDAAATVIHVNTDPGVLPAYSGGAWSRHWGLGLLSGAPSAGDQALVTYNSGTPTWTSLSAFDSWGACSSWPDDDPDVIAGLDLEGVPDVDTSAVGDVDIAFRFTLRAPRFRLVYFLDSAETPPRRGWPSNSGFTTPGNGFGRRHNIQGGPRGFGAVS